MANFPLTNFNNLFSGQTFQAYDFGPAGNQARYNQSTPLVYNLSKVTCPVYIFWAENDKACPPEVLLVHYTA